MLVSGWLRAFFSSVLPHPRSFRMHCHLSPQLHVSLQLPACSRGRCRVITALFGRRAPIIEPSSTCGDARQALVECAVCCQRMLRPERRAVTLEKFGDAGRSYQDLRRPPGRVRVHGGLPRGGCCCYYESTPPAVRPLCNGETGMSRLAHVDSREIARRLKRDIGACARRCLCNLHVLNVQGVCLRHGSNAAQQPTTQLRRGDAMPRRALKAGNVFFQESHWIHIHGSIG